MSKFRTKKLTPDKEEYIKQFNCVIKTQIKSEDELIKKEIENQILLESMGIDVYKDMRRKQYLRKKYGRGYDKLWS